MENKEKSNNERLKYAFCYVLFISIIFFFTESNKNEEFMRHIKYGFTIFVAYILLNIFLSWVVGGLLFLIYLGISGFLFYKTYVGENVDIEYIDKMEKKIKDNL